MTIHSGHPFAEANPDPLRRFRGRMPAPVTIWATGTERSRAGWTVSSLMIADGKPPQVLGLVDEDSDFFAALDSTAPDAKGATFTVNLLGGGHQMLAEVFAGLAPAPGGAFTRGNWIDSAYGPQLADAIGWLGVRRIGPFEHAGWARLVRGVVEQVEIGDGAALAHVRGRYRELSPKH